MTFRAFAIDLDGTLLVGEHVPQENIQALRTAHAAGFQIIIATARWVQMAQRVEAEIGIKGPVIAIFSISGCPLISWTTSMPSAIPSVVWPR
jgi:hydroxymethylpyrimidine pyrophosphatase-like HAD family hydrolase